MLAHGMIVRHINGTKKGEIVARGENGGWVVQWEGDDWSQEYPAVNLVAV